MKCRANQIKLLKIYVTMQKSILYTYKTNEQCAHNQYNTMLETMQKLDTRNTVAILVGAVTRAPFAILTTLIRIGHTLFD